MIKSKSTLSSGFRVRVRRGESGQSLARREGQDSWEMGRG
jgi:hypothetical protein